MMRRRMAIGLGLVLLALAPLDGRAVEQRPLPVFRVLAPDGTTVQSEKLLGEARWILIYTLPNCRPCDDLLRRLKYAKSPHLSGRARLVIGAQTAAAQAYAAKKLPAEVGIPWYADAEGEAWRALNVKGTPVMFGVRQGRIEWAMSGLSEDSAPLMSTIRSWIEY